MDLLHWRGVAPPPRRAIEGRYVRLEPFSAPNHTATLYQASVAPGQEDRFRYLPDDPPLDRASFDAWFESKALSQDPLFFAVIDRATGRAEGRQSLMRMECAHGAIEIGHILWGPAIARSQVATEALFLCADLIFTLGYRRFEWKCNALNAPSRKAAERFGFRFEGVFRQHMVLKGRNRDTAWFAMTDGDWQALKPGYLAWLAPENFDAMGRQRRSLAQML